MNSAIFRSDSLRFKRSRPSKILNANLDRPGSFKSQLALLPSIPGQSNPQIDVMQGQVQYEEEEEVFEDSMDFGNHHQSAGDIVYNQQESGQSIVLLLIYSSNLQ